MSPSRLARRLAPGGSILALALAAVLLAPAAGEAASTHPAPATGWHGRAIQAPVDDHARSAVTGRTVLERTTRELAPGTGMWSRHGSAAVRRLQRDLTRLGYRPGPIDGRYGPRTAGAVAWFQRKHGFRVDGVARPAVQRHVHWRLAQGGPELGQEPLAPRPAAPATAAAVHSGPAQVVVAPPPARLSDGAMRAILLGVVALGLLVLVGSYARTRIRVRRATVRALDAHTQGRSW
jgi:peptidoglycan hydrolase-like protein with peptidoglycan-binding domain